MNQIELLLEDGRELRTRLRQAEAPLRRAIRRINAGEQPMTALTASGAAEARLRVNESLKRLEEHRRTFRLDVLVAELDAGASMGSIARQWGVSRQLVQRLAKEARSRPPT